MMACCLHRGAEVGIEKKSGVEACRELRYTARPTSWRTAVRGSGTIDGAQRARVPEVLREAVAFGYVEDEGD